MSMQTFTSYLLLALATAGCAVASEEGPNAGANLGQDVTDADPMDMGTGGDGAMGTPNDGTGGMTTGGPVNNPLSDGTGGTPAVVDEGDPIDALESGAPGDVLLMDDFEGGAATWFENDKNVWSVVTDESQAYQQIVSAVDDTYIAIGGHPTWTNVYIEARVKLNAGGDSSDDMAMLLVRASDESNFYYVALQGDGSMKLRKRSDGSNSSIGTTYNDANIVQGTWYTVGVEVIGSTINMYLDGQLVQEVDEPDKYSATDTDLSAGYAGFGTRGEMSATFDDVRIEQR